MAACAVWTSCDKVNPPIYGCVDPLATNYNADNTLPDGPCLGDCEYGSDAILGCTDPTALNYNPDATSNNCDCAYEGQRKILLEEYTGHTCGNCPRAAEKLKDLMITHSGSIVPIAVHVGFFAEPHTNHSSGGYQYDFRTAEGDEYDLAFNNSNMGLPNGLINRQNDAGTYPIFHPSWDQPVQDLVDLDPEALIDIGVIYDEAVRSADITVDVSSLADLTAGPYKLSVVITEDSIYNWQTDYDLPSGQQDIPDYLHMFVLRESLNGPWGSELASGGSLTLGYSESQTFNITLDSEYVDHNCNIVAYISREADRSVIQAESVPVIQQ